MQSCVLSTVAENNFQTQFDFSAIKEKNLDGGSTAENYGKQWFT